MSLGEGSGAYDKRAAASSALNWCNEAITLGEAKEIALTLLRERISSFVEN